MYIVVMMPKTIVLEFIITTIYTLRRLLIKNM